MHAQFSFAPTTQSHVIHLFLGGVVGLQVGATIALRAAARART